jgi:hypothetical protein
MSRDPLNPVFKIQVALDGDDSVTIAAEAVKDYLIEHLDHLLKTEQIRSYQMFDTLMEGD